MSHQDHFQPNENAEQPAMELIGGDATDAAPAGGSPLSHLVRGTIYGTVILGATALLAVIAVPELARYASFLPGSSNGASCSMSGSSCTALDVAALHCENYRPDDEDEQSVALTEESCSGCPLSRSALMTGVPACCSQTESVSATATCTEGSGCADGKTCCQDTLAKATPEEDALVKVEGDETLVETPAAEATEEN